MSDLETLKAQYPEWKKWPHKCFEFCVALQELIQQHEAELAKAQETIQQRERELEEIPWKAWYRVREVLESGHGDDHGAIMDAVLNVHSARAQQESEAKKGDTHDR